MYITPQTTFFLFITILIALAQSSTTTSSSVTRMIPVASTTAPAVTMAWDNEAVTTTAEASNSDPAMQAATTSMATDVDTKIPYGSSTSMSDTSSVKSMNGMITGTAMAGMNMTGAAGRAGAEIVAGGMGVRVVKLGVGACVLMGML